MVWINLQQDINNKQLSSLTSYVLEVRSSHFSKTMAARTLALTCKYCPRVRISTSIALKSAMASFNSSSVSPSPNIIEDLVIIPSLASFACFKTYKLCSYLHQINYFTYTKNWRFSTIKNAISLKNWIFECVPNF